MKGCNAKLLNYHVVSCHKLPVEGKKKLPVTDEVGGERDGLVAPADPLLLHQHRHPPPLELHPAELLAEPVEPLVAAARERQKHTVEFLHLRRRRRQEHRHLLGARGKKPRPLAAGSLNACRQARAQAGPVVGPR
jgi:hypothetical protein